VLDFAQKEIRTSQAAKEGRANALQVDKQRTEPSDCHSWCSLERDDCRLLWTSGKLNLLVTQFLDSSTSYIGVVFPFLVGSSLLDDGLPLAIGRHSQTFFRAHALFWLVVLPAVFGLLFELVAVDVTYPIVDPL
jgi:hypothetical protein